MINKNAAEYLEALGKALTGDTENMAIEEFDDEVALMLGCVSPFNENDEIGYIISLKDIDKGLLLAELMLVLFSEMPEDKLADVNRIVTELDPRILLGSFSILEDNRSLSFRHGLIYDEAVSIDSFTDNMLRNIALMENTVNNCGGYIYSLLTGESTADEIIRSIREL